MRGFHSRTGMAHCWEWRPRFRMLLPYDVSGKVFMKIAVLSDIHGNIAALEAVLADVERHAVDAIYCAGDLVGLGPRPREVVALVRDSDLPSVKGNHEVELIAQVTGKKPANKEHIAWTAKQLKKRHVRFLDGLPFHLEADVDGSRMLLLHGSPRGVYDYLFPSLTPRSLDAKFPPDFARPDILACGHTHMPFARRVGGMLVVNAGTVGRPLDGDPRACWALIETADGRPPRGRILRTEYDFEITLNAMKAAGYPKSRTKPFRASIRTWPPRKEGRL